MHFIRLALIQICDLLVTRWLFETYWTVTYLVGQRLRHRGKHRTQCKIQKAKSLLNNHSHTWEVSPEQANKSRQGVPELQQTVNTDTKECWKAEHTRENKDNLARNNKDRGVYICVWLRARPKAGEGALVWLTGKQQWVRNRSNRKC